MRKMYFFFILSIAFILTSCSGNSENAENEGNYSGLKAWWNENTADISSSTKEQWAEFKAEFQEWKAKINREDLNDEEKAEYDKMDSDVATWESDLNKRW